MERRQASLAAARRTKTDRNEGEKVRKEEGKKTWTKRRLRAKKSERSRESSSSSSSSSSEQPAAQEETEEATAELKFRFRSFRACSASNGSRE